MAGDRQLVMYTVDSFSSSPFSGNPAAVCLDTVGLSDDEMQKIAAEMNLSETSFVRTISPDDSFESGRRFHLRWFTPATEVKLCGHATLAVACVFFDKLGNANDALEFETLSGVLITTRKGKLINMDFPSDAPEPQSIDVIEDLIKFVCGDLPVKEVRFSKRLKFLVVRLEDSVTRAQFDAIPVPDKDKAIALGKPIDPFVVNVTLKSDGQPYDYVSRVFAPWAGISEDPVTGSSYTVSGPYWAAQLNKKQLYVRQGGARQGDIHVHVPGGDRVEVAGAGTIVLSGHINM